MEYAMKSRKHSVKVTFGELVAALFEETKKMTRNRMEQNLLVYAALRNMMKGRKLRPVAVRSKYSY
jgi:hypothetical protein